VTQEHDDNINCRLLVQPGGEIAVCCVIGGLRSGMAFMIIIRSGELGKTILGSLLRTNKVDIADTSTLELCEEIVAPASLGLRQQGWLSTMTGAENLL
tara:strand:+ start:7391 stop:7684 length:294 start_codon:yes stop_codon:yes gene_type:complete